MQPSKKRNFYRPHLLLLLVLLCCAPIALKADILGSAIALAPSNLLLAAGGLLTLLGLLRPLKRKPQQEEE